MPEPSSWNTPRVSPLAINSYVGASSRLRQAGPNSLPPDAMNLSARSMTVSVFKPRKSNFTRPAISAYFMLNCEAGSSARGSL